MAESAPSGLTGYTLIGVAPRSIDLLCIRRSAPIAAILTCEGGSADTNVNGQRIHSLSLEERRGVREAWTNRDIDRLASFLTEARLPDGIRTPLAILPYCSSPRWEQTTDEGRRPRFAAIPSHLKERLDDKGWVRRELGRAGIPIPQTVLVARNDLDHAELGNKLGEPFVVQRRSGSSGYGTYLVETPKALARIVRTNANVASWLVSAHAGDCTVNVHGLVLGDHVEVTMPSIQLTGVAELGTSYGTYCGSDFGAAATLDASTRDAAVSLASDSGKWLATLGYQGVFGVDLTVGDRVRVLEINPRMQASTWLLSEMESDAGALPMVVAHFECLLGHRVKRESYSFTRTAAAQVLLRWQGTAALDFDTALGNGIYALNRRDRLQFRRSAPGLIECEEGEFLVSGLPPTGRRMIVQPGAVLARIAAWETLASADGRTLTETARRIVSALNTALIPSSVDAPTTVS